MMPFNRYELVESKLTEINRRLSIFARQNASDLERIFRRQLQYQEEELQDRPSTPTPPGGIVRRTPTPLHLPRLSFPDPSTSPTYLMPSNSGRPNSWLLVPPHPIHGTTPAAASVPATTAALAAQYTQCSMQSARNNFIITMLYDWLSLFSIHHPNQHVLVCRSVLGRLWR